MTEPAIEPAVHDLKAHIQFADQGIVSKTLFQSPSMKIVLFCFEPGQALSEHTAPFEAAIQVLEGKGTVRLGEEDYEAAPGALYIMPAGLNHAVKAKERFVFLLTMIRQQKLAKLK
jgi:quercetin dioxygenase-like cupin family protein